jgi:hypothetical protein
MKINFTRELKALSGEPLKEAPEVNVTLGKITCQALLASHRDEKVDGEEQVKRWHLACRIQQADGPLEITVEQVALIKALISRSYDSAMIVGQAWELLEGSQ